MNKPNRLVVIAVVVGATVIAACLGSLTLLETEQHAMSYPTSASAGSVMVGESGTTPPIVFSPLTVSDHDTIMTVVENCSSWGLNLDPLPADVYCDGISGSNDPMTLCVPQTYSFTATFTPTGPGTNNCAVSVTYRSNTGNGTGTGSSTISTVYLVLVGTGVAPTYSLTVSPTAGSPLEYKDIPINTTSSTQQITVTNSGNSSLTVMGTNSSPMIFPLTPQGGSSFPNQVLNPGQTARYNVACRPPIVASYAETITFDTGPTQGGLRHTVNLVCNGITSDLVINPNPAGFARNTFVGQAPPELVINVTNNGLDTAFTEVRLENGTAVTITGLPQSPLSGGMSTTIKLAYDAAVEHPFGGIDNLIITHNPGGVRTVVISAEALIGEIGVTPALVDFGPVCPGSDKAVELMVYATASGRVNLMSVTQPNAPFSVIGTGGFLEPNHGNIITMTASVSATIAGDLDDSFVLNTNLPGAAATHEVMLSGVALPAGVTPTPDLVQFGSGPIGTPTTAKKVTVSNCGTTALDITGVRIEGPNASEFVIVAPEDPLQTIPTTGQLDFLIIMNPARAGTKTAKLVVEHAGGRIEANLDGNGFGDTDEDDDKSTYYTCSTGGSVGGLPLVLAILALRRRRRLA
ncbi:MAG: choice-of-anchor D domain-containing protein [Kofleriaceae bacterium]